ncbi:hypothetical protein AAMO2058_000481100 [Amorphochlora amoebiformis]
MDPVDTEEATLDAIRSCLTGEKYVENVKVCIDLASTGVIRDAMALKEEDFSQLFQAFLKSAFSLHSKDSDTDNPKRCDEMIPESLALAYQFATMTMMLPEFSEKMFLSAIDRDIIAGCINRFGNPGEESFLEMVVMRGYETRESERGIMRGELGYVLKKATKGFASSNLRKRASAAASALRVMLPILDGLRVPVTKSTHTLLTQLILPLHSMPGKVSHREPILQIIHTPLVRCLHAILRKDATLFGTVIRGILSSWPLRSAGNTPKEVLLLSELGSVLGLGDKGLKVSKLELALLCGRLAGCIASPNSLVSQSALRLFSSDGAKLIFRQFPDKTTSFLVSSVVQGLDHWNQTVRKMSKNVLRFLVEISKSHVHTTVKTLWSDHPNPLQKLSSLISTPPPSELAPEEKEAKTVSTKGSAGKASPSGSGSPSTGTPRSGAVEREDLTLFDLVFGKDLGKGSFATVREAFKIVKGKPRSEWKAYAVKNVAKEHQKVAEREVKVMQDLRHPNLIGLVCVFTSQKAIHLVMEYAKKGDVHTLLNRHGPLQLQVTQFLCAEVVSGIGFIHSKGYVFGDLKPENVLIMDSGHAKLGDFGATRKLSECKAGSRIEGTAIYLPPEVLKGNAATYAADYWALGCLIFQLLAGMPPLRIHKDFDLDSVANRSVSFTVEEKGLFPDHFTPEVKCIIRGLLDKDRAKRLGSRGVSEVKEHAFFASVDFNTIHKQTPPELKGSGVPKPQGGAWSRRSFSIMFNPIPDTQDMLGQENEGEKVCILEKEKESHESWASQQYNRWRPLYESKKQVPAEKIKNPKIPPNKAPPRPPQRSTVKQRTPMLPKTGRSAVPITGVMPGRGGKVHMASRSRMAVGRPGLGPSRRFRTPGNPGIPVGNPSATPGGGGGPSSKLKRRREAKNRSFIDSLHSGAG